MAAVPGSPESPGSPYHPTTARDAAARGAAGLRGQPTPSEVIAGLRATSHGDDLVQLLSPEGTLTAHEDFPFEVDAELLRGLYRDMVLVRRFDREGNALQRQGQLSIWVPLLGQEAAQIGAGRALRPSDMAFPSYREHGVAWCRGVDPTQLLGIFRGTDHCGWDPKATRFNCYTIVIGNQVLNATGYAMGQRFDGVIGSGRGRRGDAATRPPSCSSVTAPPARATCTRAWCSPRRSTRRWSSTARTTSGPSPNRWRSSRRVPLWERSTGYGFPGVRVDGNDVVACLAVTRWALEECRSGNGPVMIEAFTYRMDAHTTSDDPTRYRLADEEQHWKLLDPIERVKVHLSRQGMADQEFFDSVGAEADELAARFRAHCIAMPKPPPERIFANVYSEPHHQLDQQQAEYLAYLASFEDQTPDAGQVTR